MRITSNKNPARLARTFNKPITLIVQVTGAQVITLAREQGEAQDPNDGINIGSANTGGTVSQPIVLPWSGELWHRSSVDGGSFVILIIGDAP